jgi:hypothetical protein
MANAVRNIYRAISNENLTVILPIAGIGRNMKHRGPKALLRIDEDFSILSKQVQIISSAFPKADIIAVSGFQHEKIRSHVWKNIPCRIVNNKEYENTGVTYGVSLAIDASLPSNILVIHGDIIFNDEAIKKMPISESSLLVDRKGQIGSGEVGIDFTDGKISGLSYPSPIKWGQMVFLRGKELEIFYKLVRNTEMSCRWMLHESINYIINKGGNFIPCESQNSFISEIDKYIDLERYYKEHENISKKK